MADTLTLLDILEARQLLRAGRPFQPHVLSSFEALRWCHLSDHRIKACCHCRGDHETCQRLIARGEHDG